MKDWRMFCETESDSKAKTVMEILLKNDIPIRVGLFENTWKVFVEKEVKR